MRPSSIGRLLVLLPICLLVMACAAGSGASIGGLGSGGGAAGGRGEPPAQPAPAASSQPDEDETGGGRDGSGENAAPLPGDQQIVKTGSLELEVSELDPALLRARTAIVGLGGYIAASQQSSGTGKDVASVTYRIPADRWDDALDALKKLSTKLLGERTEATEVSSELVDLGARIKNLEAEEIQIQGIMARAEKIEDILQVQAQLSGVRGQIEQLKAQQAHLQDQAALGTLAVTYLVPVAPIPPVVEAQESWDPQAEIDRAVAQLVQVGQAAGSVVIYLGIVILPLLLVIGFLAAIVLVIARRLRLAPPPPPAVDPTA
jgi:Domain of unknown function (DUF4349)